MFGKQAKAVVTGVEDWWNQNETFRTMSGT